ncbi:MAG TPA: Rieske (2Fe-2S) protein [Gemmatimonadaceae bacterium]|nr:Rieske (2Fe-2S) protein [Gemmatimonadaceae bacterium]
MMKDVTGTNGACGRDCGCGRSGNDGDAIERRDFVTRAAAALAAVALAACGMSDSLTSPSTVKSTTLTLSSYPNLANVGGVATTSVDGIPVAIVRTSQSTFAAFSRICPHQGTTINVTATGFQCPRHGATFNASGQWIGGQRTSNLTQYPVAYDAGAGTLTVG